MAAAVSDFYIPDSSLSTHKIQSKDHGDGLTISLEPVPKKLKSIVEDWNPNTFLVSFKLETDSKILLEKARSAIEKYNVHLVVANELHSRYDQAVLISAVEGSEPVILNKNPSDPIEKEIVEGIINAHISA
ncbi:unnamed protein product [Moneuplotes crassus]|uniref:DNA/pantothenate metabolism flavoprotein C-terminal domain-containing protein n=1 Tax=Euplotes crassus TaxID=5936 RepID=A0AAD1UPJ4_EUPCR|nr:unnamed protein product [Moneuplotes crassus]